MATDDDFAPKIFIVGRDNRLLSQFLEAIVTEAQNRFGVRSAGIDPGHAPDPILVDVLDSLDLEEVDPASLRSSPISRVLDDHVRLVVYTTSEVKEEGPIIATTGDKITLDCQSLRDMLNRSEDPDEYREVYDCLRDKALPDILDALGLD